MGQKFLKFAAPKPKADGLTFEKEIKMIKKFLTENTNREILLAKGMKTFTGILASKGQDFWIVGSQMFHISQISTCGNLDKPYVVVI